MAGELGSVDAIWRQERAPLVVADQVVDSFDLINPHHLIKDKLRLLQRFAFDNIK